MQPEPPTVPLSADHPGFRDAAYRRRRDAIAQIARAHERGAPVPDAPYTDDEQRVWRAIWRELAPLHTRHVCRELRDVQDRLGLARGPIPQLAGLNVALQAATGFRMEPVTGLVEARTFLTALADGCFLSTQYIRHASRPRYTPEPDVVHEAIGHAASLTHPRIAAVNRAFGAAAARADPARLRQIERVYRYTREFGVVREHGQPRAFGAGLLSSAGELAHLHEGAELLEADLPTMAETDYDPTDLQPRLFAARSFDDLLDPLERWLERSPPRR
jgi:phenylalanine-4-hydroxylase